MSRPWMVLKFGGTSVASADCWTLIARRVRELLPERRVWITASALAGVTDRLEEAVARAVHGRETPAPAWIRAEHRRLASELGVPDEALRPVEELLDGLDRWLEGVRLTGEASPRMRARIGSVGELASTRLGVAALARHGIDARWVDAREFLRAEPRREATDADRYLEARVPAISDPDRGERAADGAEVVLTQGFVASTADGETCLLGRGGSDTSGALFAVLLRATSYEIWTDVPGLFTADPRMIPSARLILKIGYREAQELAALGAKVLHPRCLRPVAEALVPVCIRSTREPEREGTLIEGGEEEHAAVTAVTCRKGATLVTLRTWAMWETPGFLARVFALFAERGMSVDLVGTSQAAVSVTLDRVPGGEDGRPFRDALERLREHGRVQVVHPCAVVSIVGRRIRSALHELGPALAAFEEMPVHLVSDSSEDLNLSFVVDEEDAGKLVARLHAALFSPQGAEGRLGPTWEKMQGTLASGAPEAVVRPEPWWRREREEILRILADGRPRYVYCIPEVRRKARELREALGSVARFYYAVKANAHPAVLQAVAAEGFGFECVSAEEVRRARGAGGADAALLFTPNFCPVEEYREAMAAGAEVTLDGDNLLEQAPDLFRGAEVALRIDPGEGLGHHEKVRTAGAHAKFGLPLERVARFADAAARLGIRVVGLHAHVGSGILDPGAWTRTGEVLSRAAADFPDVRWINVGGGLGLPRGPGDCPLDLAAMERALAGVRRSLAESGIELRLEPGRYVVGEAGVLVAPATQVRSKSGVNFIGMATGMNSLIRPALYGAWHPIHNLTRLDEPARDYWHVVGPICETGDVLGRDRWMPETSPGDVLLIENVGAYGSVMSSRYNLRDPAEEVVLPVG